MSASPERRLDQIEASLIGSDRSVANVPVVPNIIDFVVGSKYLNKPKLYPRQALLLKLIFLELDLLTDYDWEVLDKWGLGSSGGLEKNRSYGIPSDLLRRLDLLRSNGRMWVREVIAVIGRRGSKGYIGAIATSYIVFHLLATGDPQQHFDLAQGKTLTIPVFAQGKDQARDVMWRDIANMIEAAPCFAPFIARRGADRISLCSPAQLELPESKRGVPAIEIVARESTESAARGFTSPVVIHDEMAHEQPSGASNAERMYVSSTPAQATFPGFAFSYLPSSPRHKTGQFYELYEQSLEVGTDGTATNPEMLSIQVPSWELYEDWDRAHLIPIYPGGPTFARLGRALVSPDDPDIARIRRTNPEMYRVEFLSQWMEVQNQFLGPEMVERMFADDELKMREVGNRQTTYVIHVDLSKVGDNTALVVAHAETTDDPMRPLIIIDLIRVWRPSDFPDGRIQYSAVEAEVRRYMESFRPHRVTFDPWQSMAMIQNLTHFARSQRLRTQVMELKTTNQSNRAMAETFKSALYDGRIKAPFHELARDELLFLQDLGAKVDHPSSGPVTTNDVVSCLFAVVDALHELAVDPGRLFSAVGLRGMNYPVSGSDQAVFDALSGFTRYQTPRARFAAPRSRHPRRSGW